MSVVFHRSAGKMILKTFVAGVILSFAWIKSVAGAPSYSSVYMQSGPGLALYEPTAIRSAQLAPLSAAPLMSSVLPPCVSPCVIPNQRVAALAPVATSSANFVTYNTPIRVPVVVAPNNDDATSYEYSYVVYDEDTGDQKAQKESSDGSVVRGQYSLIQPDGYVREVQYTADDLRGFNAVVKNFLPKGEAKAIPPCPENKNEPLKEAQEKTNEAQNLEPEAHGEFQNEQHGHGGESPEEHETHAEPKLEVLGHKESESHEEPQKHDDQRHEEQESHKEHTGREGYGKPESHDELIGHEDQKDHGEQEEHGEPERHEDPHRIKEYEEKKKKKEPWATQGATVLPNTDVLVSYNDVIKCIQSAINQANSPQPSPSPLTYIILNKPC